MDEILCRLLEDALHHPELKQQLLQTEHADDPMDAFCQLATQLGYPINIGDLFAMGQEYHDNLMKSVNGGGVETPDGWDDAYEQFFAALHTK